MSETLQYITLAAILADFMLGIWQSIQFNHFKSSCMGGRVCTVDDEIHMTVKTATPNTIQEIKIDQP